MSTNPVLQAASVNSGDGDVFGWVQGWRFAIAGYLWHVLDVKVSGFRPGIGGPDYSFEYEELTNMDPKAADLMYALDILDRYRRWVGIAGRDY